MQRAKVPTTNIVEANITRKEVVLSKVFLIDSKKRPLNPIHPAQARQLLRNKKAAVFRRFPFTLILKEVCPLS
nr:RRXRR domain-containing protein [Xenococcaceae cyanobacterium MO_207.B15]